MTATSKEPSDPLTWLQMDTALKMLEHAINSDANYRGVLLTQPETMANAFKAYTMPREQRLLELLPRATTESPGQVGIRTVSSRWVRAVDPTKPLSSPLISSVGASSGD